MKQFSPWCWLWLVLFPGYGMAAANITGLHLQEAEGYNALVIDLDGPVGINLFTLDGPDRVVVDLPGAHLRNSRQMQALKGGLLRGARAAAQGDGRLRIVLDVTRPIWPRSYFTGDDKKRSLVVELRDSSGKSKPTAALVSTQPSVVTPPKAESQPVPVASSDHPQPLVSTQPPAQLTVVAPQSSRLAGKLSSNTGFRPEPVAPARPTPPEVATVVHGALVSRPANPVSSPSVLPPIVVGEEEPSRNSGSLKGRGKFAGISPPSSSASPLAERHASDAVLMSLPSALQTTSPPSSRSRASTPWGDRSSALLSPSPAVKPRDIVVAVDAGHGGKDPGATGPGGTEEKNVTLAIARRVAELLRRERGMRPILTRSSDSFVPLRERIQKAHTFKADLFVSIHADAANDSSVTGASIYILSERGASSEAARMLAEQENSVDLVGGVHLEGRDNNLARTLLDMSQSATRDASLAVASRLLTSMEQIGTLSRTAVERAGFLVLKSPDIPSVLVETAYLSNPDEEEKLADPDYQQTIAQAIMKGVRAYFLRSPPSGTLLAQQAQAMQVGSMELVRR
ncbi:N-acetylmuramoyl-L-alanine amidase [Gammaproteobacteria bacterium]